MEWGPRALGNRSILGDPRRADMKNILNLKIKRRESFRPFAPSILREAVADWFERDDDVPFMLQVFPIRPERRAANTGGNPRRRHRPAANRRSRQQSAILRRHRIVLPTDRCSDGAEHLIQRKRAGRLPTGGSVGLLPAHKNGPSGSGQLSGPSQRRSRRIGAGCGSNRLNISCACGFAACLGAMLWMSRYLDIMTLPHRRIAGRAAACRSRPERLHMHLERRILVTGGAGFLGSHLCERLLATAPTSSASTITSPARGVTSNAILDHHRFELLRHDVTFPLYRRGR